MIDTHCHLTSDVLRNRLDEVLAAARAAGVRRMITVSTTSADCAAARALAAAHAEIWFSAGVHPLHADEPRDWSLVRDAAKDPRCVAWGELGLDNHYEKPPRAVQHAALEEELAFIARCASEDHLAKPVIVHCRDAFEDLLGIFRDWCSGSGAAMRPDRFVFHCFTGGPDEARRVLEFGAWISFTGVVTFHNAPEVAAAARIAPLDRMMVETDSPFLSPEPVRKVKPNEPCHVVHIANFLADLRGVPREEFEVVMDANAERFFALPPLAPA
jgi:TatD DNase family protein